MTSLFTNIPVSEIIKLAVDLIKTSQPDLNISEKDLTSLFIFASCETHFLFIGKVYDQIDGEQWGYLSEFFLISYISFSPAFGK